jgi:hypothetical protein
MEGEEMKKNESPMEGIPVPEVAVAKEEPPDKKEAMVEEPQDVYQLMDQRDEAQIVAALEGRYLDDFVYEVDSGGDKVVGLSWIGIQEASPRRQVGPTEVSSVGSWRSERPRPM